MVSLGMQTQYVAEWDLIHHEIMELKNVQREYTGVNESTLEAWCNHEPSVNNGRASNSKAASPLTQESNDELERLRRLKDEVAMWRVVGKSSREPCFGGLIQNINMVLQMLDFLLTGQQNQD